MQPTALRSNTLCCSCSITLTHYPTANFAQLQSSNNTVKTMSKINLPKCPIELGQHVAFVEDQDQPDRLGYGIVVGLNWSPGHWVAPGWVALVSAYHLDRSPWLITPHDDELPVTELHPIADPVPPDVAQLFAGQTGVSLGESAPQI